MEDKRKTAVITGGAGGLGSALAVDLVDDGWHVCLLDLPNADFAKAIDGLPADRVTTYACDITYNEQVELVSTRIIATRPSIDLVIYNAGVSQIGELRAEPVGAHRRVFDINYFGALYLLREMIEPVRKARGRHLAISSVAGFSPLYHRTAYSASKHALEGLFKSLRAEEKAHGVGVFIAAPSFVATNIGNPDEKAGGIVRPGSATDGVDYMSPERAAHEIIDGLRRNKPFIPVGRVARLAWLVNRLSPETYFRMMLKKIGDKS